MVGGFRQGRAPTLGKTGPQVSRLRRLPPTRRRAETRSFALPMFLIVQCYDALVYREFSPAERLRRSVACLWTMTSSGRSHRVLPDGCMDILLRRKSANEPFVAEIVGTMTTAIVVAEASSAESIGVRFAPGESFRLLALPAHEATDEMVPLKVAWGALAKELESRVSDAPTTEARLAAVERVLEDRLRSAAPVDLRVRKVIDALCSRVAPPRDLHVGSRQLRRLFKTYVGISPKVFQRVVRMQRAVGRMDRAPSSSWAGIATDCGYFDQSHLVREFRSLVGLSPTTFARTRAVSVSSKAWAPSFGS